LHLKWKEIIINNNNRISRIRRRRRETREGPGAKYQKNMVH